MARSRTSDGAFMVNRVRGGGGLHTTASHMTCSGQAVNNDFEWSSLRDVLAAKKCCESCFPHHFVINFIELVDEKKQFTHR